MPPSLRSASRTHVGRVRQENEDDLLDLPDAGLFVVADGMGGHAAGEVASRMAVETLAEAMAAAAGTTEDADPGRPRPDRLVPAIEEANRRIHEESSRDASRSGMGTTVTALLVDEGGWHLGHVGDSRAYLLRDGELRRLSRDHSWVQEQVEAGDLTREQARVHPASSILTRALGTDRYVEVDRRDGEIRPGDRYLLASDGLTDMMPEARLAELLGAGESPEEVVRGLVREALDGGGRDNVTAVVVEVGPDGT